MNRENETEQKKGCGSNIIGLLIFFLIAGSQFIQPVLNSLGQVLGPQTAQQLGSSLSSLLPFIIVGLVVLSVIIPLLTAIARGVGQLGQGNNPPPPRPVNLPSPTTSLPGQSRLPPSRLPSSWPTQSGTTLPSSSYPSSSIPRRSTGYSSPSTRSTTSASSIYTGGGSLPRPILTGTSMDMERMRVSMGGQQPYKTPGFEPVVDGKVVTFGILGLLLLAGGIAFGNWLLSVLP